MFNLGATIQSVFPCCSLLESECLPGRWGPRQCRDGAVEADRPSLGAKIRILPEGTREQLLTRANAPTVNRRPLYVPYLRPR